MPFIDFTTGQVLTADQMDLVMRQSVMRFADAATRDTALAEVLAEGMIAYLDDTNEVLKYDGTAWVNVNDNDDSIQKSVLAAAGDIIVATAAGTPSALTIGTAGQILESNGTALSYVTPDASPDDIITTQGDLIIGDASANAARIAIGAADTVLTSNGTSATWEAAAGGGVGDWEEIVSAVSVGTAQEFELTGLSGHSDYVFLLNDVRHDGGTSADEIFISNINGALGATGGAQMIIENRSNNGVIEVTKATNIKLAKLSNNLRDLYATILIQGAGSTTPALCEWVAGSDTSTDNDKSFIGKTIISKNSQALDTVTFRVQVSNFLSGTITVYAR